MNARKLSFLLILILLFLVACGGTADIEPTAVPTDIPATAAPTATLKIVTPVVATPTPEIIAPTATAVPAEAAVEIEAETETETENAEDDHRTGEPNRLINEQSPYLQQHAYNPVDWYAWGEEAFLAANIQNKPIFLSIGYSTCHWCHVMEAESFENEEVAALMNDAFINIKVDREERPDIDSIYMNVVQLMNGSGGWPLNIVMTPDQRPFYAATYIAREDRYGRAGMFSIVPQLKDAWQNSPNDVYDLANRVTDAVREINSRATAGGALTDATLTSTFEQMQTVYDPIYGGFSEPTKFPRPHNLLFLFRYYNRTGDEDALTMAETTLKNMRRGGIYDHIGFGFHRYSTDPEWKTPHFEKMLYDQALLTMAYTEAYQVTENADYRQTAAEVLYYVQRDMTDPMGGFYSAEDADSEGEEGLFYHWTTVEMTNLLNREDNAFVTEKFDLLPEGNFLDEATHQKLGRNLLYLPGPMTDEEKAQWETIRPRLFDVREERIHPYKDDKILTDWNGLMIAALARAGVVFDEPAYIEQAQNAADFLLATMVDENGRLLHRYRGGEAAIMGQLDDYAFLTWGLLELYEATFDQVYLEEAIRLNDQAYTYFWDDESDGYYLTADDAELLITRPKEIYDGAIPSGNSIQMMNLLRINRLTAVIEYEEQAAALADTFAGSIAPAPFGYTALINALDFAVGPSFEVVIVGEKGAADTQALIDGVNSVYVPNKVVLLRPPGDDQSIIDIAPYTKYQYAFDDKATAYVCLNFVCNTPTTDVEQMVEYLLNPIEPTEVDE